MICSDRCCRGRIPADFARRRATVVAVRSFERTCVRLSAGMLVLLVAFNLWVRL